MKKHILYISFFLSAFLICSETIAQQRLSQFRGRRTVFSKNQRYYSTGVSLNTLNYFGDLAPKGHFTSTKIAYTRPGLGLNGSFRMGPRSSIRSTFMWGRLKGDDYGADQMGPESRFRYIRNQHFRNDIKELSIDYSYDLIPHFRTFVTRPELVPYVFVGIAIFHHNPKAKVPERDYVHGTFVDNWAIEQNDPRYAGVSPGEWIALKPLGTEGQYVAGSGVEPYSNWQIAIPFGAGVRYKLSRYFDLSFEISYRQTFTDYLDDVSANYLNPNEFGTGPEANLARLMANRSKEINAAVSGDVRITNEYLEFINNHQGISEIDILIPDEFNRVGPYQVINGYGSAHPDNIRGKEDFDVYIVTKLQLTYIIGTNIRNAKFR